MYLRWKFECCGNNGPAQPFARYIYICIGVFIRVTVSFCNKVLIYSCANVYMKNDLLGLFAEVTLIKIYILSNRFSIESEFQLIY